ncbi:hypothetical protein POJ06DRAFT_260985 [Lipomyces tetrasporus]|uniref:FAR1 domain-containing protein n=1 Tax=Lipomyces tetrasporus TaxID=54092 RepID=A0AAD7VQ80_9ASCO|nr:uncharacterized protein POJ06DRAFT_260985 [Lipomyces tetrasporus]KAJ8097284.1 hypothetical protein POJ06DRAFT_260985 [Lipomyces tetrasporus]
MDITDFTNSVSPVQLQDPTLSTASHLSLTATLSSLPQAISIHPHRHHHLSPDKTHHAIDHQLQQLQQQQEQEEARHQHQIHPDIHPDLEAHESTILLAPDEPLDLSQTFPSKDALLLHLNRYASLAGFRLSRTSSRPEHIRIQCWKRSKTSKYTRTDDPRKRRASFGTTRSTDCPFYLNCWHNKKSGCWYIKSSNVLHNHGFAQDLISKKSLTNEEKNLLRDLSYAGSDLTRSIPVKIINAKRRERGIPDVDPKLVSNTLTRFRQQRSEQQEQDELRQ